MKNEIIEMSKKCYSEAMKNLYLFKTFSEKYDIYVMGTDDLGKDFVMTFVNGKWNCMDFDNAFGGGIYDYSTAVKIFEELSKYLNDNADELKNVYETLVLVLKDKVNNKIVMEKEILTLDSE